MVSEVQIRNKDGSLAQTTTDNVNAAIGGTDAPAAGDTGASTTNGFLRWLRDKLYSISPSNWLVVGGAAAVGSSPTVPPVGVSGIDGSGLKRAILVNASGATVADNSVMASDGVMLPIDSIAQTLGYTAGDLTTITVVYGGNTYVQTLTYTSGNITAISKWVKQ